MPEDAVDAVTWTLFRPTRDRAAFLLWILALTITAIEIRAIIVYGWGVDSHSYWTTWTQGVAYDRVPLETGAFLYSPVFAQLIYPLTLLPWPVFAALWLGISLVGYWWLLRRTPAVWAVPLFLLALDDVRVGNVNWLLAASCVVGMRWSPGWMGALFTKVAPAVGVLWYLPRHDWRALARFAAWSIGVAAVSFAISPGLWIAWLALLDTSRGSGATVRLVLAAVVTIYAGRRGWAWLMPFVLILASPVSAVYTLGFFCAMPRLLSPEVQARMREPFGGVRAMARRALDLA